MFKTAYETLPCRMYKLDEVYKSLALALAGNDSALARAGAPYFSTGHTGKEVTVKPVFVIDGAVGVPIFAHPIALMEELSGNRSILAEVVCDARDATKRDFDGGWKITVQSEYNFLRTRLYLQTRWLGNFLAEAKSAPVQNFPMRIFARWISDSLTRRFNLDLDAAVRVQALAAFMYMSMHQGDKEIKDYELVDVAMKVSRATNVPSAIVTDVLEGVGYLENVEEFCDALIARVPSSRLEDLNPVVLYGITRGSWFGKNASEMVSVGIEHPPTFDAMIYAAANSSALQRTQLGTLVKTELRDRDAMEFVEKVNQIILDKE